MKTYFKVRMVSDFGTIHFGSYFAINKDDAEKKAKQKDPNCKSYKCLGENYPGKKFNNKGELIV